MRMQYYDINIYRLGDEYKVVYMKRSLVYDEKYTSHYKFQKDNSYIGDKFSCSVSRTKSSVLGLALCNPWQYFVTFTLNPELYDRSNLRQWNKDFSQYLRNRKRLHGEDIKFLLIPELHDDSVNWHMHGLMSGFDWQFLSKFNPMEHPWDLCKKGYRYDANINSKFGFNSFGKILSKAAISRYILKYVGKGLGQNHISQGNHLYYCSKGLNRPEIVSQGSSSCLLTDIDFSNDYCASAWITEDEYNKISDYIR